MRTRKKVLLAALSTLGLLWQADQSLGQAMYNRLASAWTLPSHDVHSKRVVIYLVGFQVDADIAARVQGEKFRRDATVIMVRYRQSRIDPYSLYWLAFDEIYRRGLEPDQVLIYGASMGGQIGAAFADIYGGLDLPYGKLLMLLDCAPGNASDLQMMPANPALRPIVLGLAAHMDKIAVGPIATYAKAPIVAMTWVDHEDREAGIDPADLRAYKDSFPTFPARATAAQLKFMVGFDITKYDLTEVVSHSRYITSKWPDEDPLVRGTSAVRHWRVALPNLQHVEDPNRRRGSHDATLDWPSYVADQALELFNQAV